MRCFQLVEVVHVMVLEFKVAALSDQSRLAGEKPRDGGQINLRFLVDLKLVFKWITSFCLIFVSVHGDSKCT